MLESLTVRLEAMEAGVADALNWQTRHLEKILASSRLAMARVSDREANLEWTEAKIDGLSPSLDEKTLDYGNKAAPWNFAQVSRGNRQYWTLVMRPMRSLVGFTDALMRGKPRRWGWPQGRRRARGSGLGGLLAGGRGGACLGGGQEQVEVPLRRRLGGHAVHHRKACPPWHVLPHHLGHG